MENFLYRFYSSFFIGLFAVLLFEISCFHLQNQCEKVASSPPCVRIHEKKAPLPTHRHVRHWVRLGNISNPIRDTSTHPLPTSSWVVPGVLQSHGAWPGIMGFVKAHRGRAA